MLEPLGVAHVGLFAGNAFHMAGVDQIHLNACRSENVVEGDPIIARASDGFGALLTVRFAGILFMYPP